MNGDSFSISVSTISNRIAIDFPHLELMKSGKSGKRFAHLIFIWSCKYAVKWMAFKQKP